MTNATETRPECVLAYADRDSVRPGDRLEFKVSCTGIDSYGAAIVRLRSFHTMGSAPGYPPRYDTVVPEWMLPAREQRISAGSYGVVERPPRIAGSFTLGVFIWPTLPGDGEQTVLDTLCDLAGFRLFLDAAGRVTFAIGTTEGIVSVRLEIPVTARRWYALCASWDTASGILELSQHRLHALPGPDEAAVKARRVGVPRYLAGEGPLMLAASQRAGDRRREAHFNGKIERPWLSRVACSVAEGARRRALPLTALQALPDIAALWDFGLCQDTDELIDVGPSASHGRLHNLPLRGATGSSWSGDDWNWRSVPDEYGAIHFHDDDLEDCQWSTDFTWQVPEDLRGGIYAAKLQAGKQVFYVPFYVRPPRGERRSDAVLLLSTASYLAYANYATRLFAPAADLLWGASPVVDSTDLAWLDHPEVGLSCYDLHRDGSRVTFSSRHRPLLNVRPDEPDPKMGFNNFVLDLLVADWLEHIGVGFDIVTDEDLDREGTEAIAGYRLMLTGGHPEYCSRRELDALQAFLSRGGRLMYLGGNGFFWRMAFRGDKSGVMELRRADLTQMRLYKERGQLHHVFDVGHGGLWRDLGMPAQSFVGVSTVAVAFDEARPYRRNPDATNPRVAFMFNGIADLVIGTDGILAGAASGLEIDRVDFAQGTPLHALVVASSFDHSNTFGFSAPYIEDVMPWGTNARGFAGLDEIRADMVFFETAAGGAVFSTGSIAYVGALCPNQYQNPIAQLSENVLRRFMDATTFAMPDTVPRERAVVPQW